MTFSDSEEHIMSKILAAVEDEPTMEHIEKRHILSVLTFPNLEIRINEQVVYHNGIPVPLTHHEFFTLLYLAQHPSWVLSKSMIYEAVWKADPEHCGAAVTNVVYSLRRKIGEGYIETVVGSRYRFVGLEFGGDSIGKVLVVTFTGDEEEIADKVVSALMNKGNFEYMERKAEEALYFRDLTIYPDKREVYHRGKEAGLTFTQFEILHILARKPGRVFTKEILYELLWDELYSNSADIVMSHISRIRKKIEDNSQKPFYIQTVWSVGYRFNPNAVK